MKGNIFSDYYKGHLLTKAKCRYDVKESTSCYQFLELNLIKKQSKGGLKK